MNRSTRESPMRGRRPSMAFQALQGRPVKDESLELFSWLKKCPNGQPSNDHKTSPSGGLHAKIIKSTKVKPNGVIDDLLSTDGGNNSYDWLLTPPAPSPPSHPIHSKPSLPVKDNPKIRSVSATRPLRSSQETTNSTSATKFARSSSVTRSSINNTTTRSSISNNIARSSSISNLTTRSSISITTTNKSSPNSTKQSTNSVTSKVSSSPLTRPVSSRLSSPLRHRNPITQSPPIEKHKPSTSIPSTPRTTTTVPRLPTPTRRTTPSMTSSMISPVPPVSRSSSLNRLPETKNTRIPKAVERSVSAVRHRLIGASASVSLNQRPATSPISSPRKNMTRSQFGESSLGKSRLSGLTDSKKPIRPPENAARKLMKPVPPIDKTALSRSSSRKSLDTKNTEKSNTVGHRKPAVYPRSNSNRLSTTKNRSEPSTRSGAKIVPTDEMSRGTSSDDGSVRPLSDSMFESARYETILLKEDAKNFNWLHGGDDMILQSPFHFDLPEPFDL